MDCRDRNQCASPLGGSRAARLAPGRNWPRVSERAIIATEAYGVVDVFHVTDFEYNKIHAHLVRKTIEQTILRAIGKG